MLLKMSGRPKEMVKGSILMTDNPTPTVGMDAPSVQSYLTLLQGVINRMASNCTGCKTWCITLVSATIVIIADKGKPNYVWIALVPLALFLFLDSYYLGLERRFRTLYNDFVHKLHAGTATTNDVYNLTPSGGFSVTVWSTANSCISLSIWSFYGLLAAMLIIVRLWILPRP
jgi:hypothetical protein